MTFTQLRLISLALYDKAWSILAYQKQLPSTKFIFDNDERGGMNLDSTVSGSCIISSSMIRKSLLYSSVHVHSCSVIEESVLLQESDVGENCKLKRVILDSKYVVPVGLAIAYDKKQDIVNGFGVTEKGVTLVTRSMLNALLNTD